MEKQPHKLFPVLLVSNENTCISTTIHMLVANVTSLDRVERIGAALIFVSLRQQYNKILHSNTHTHEAHVNQGSPDS